MRPFDGDGVRKKSCGWGRARRSRCRGNRSTYSKRQPWMKHARKIPRAQGVAEIESQLAEMFEDIVRRGGRLGLHRDVDKDRDFTVWYDTLPDHDDVKEQERACHDWMLENLGDLSIACEHEHDRQLAKRRLFNFLYGGRPTLEPKTSREWLHDWLLGQVDDDLCCAQHCPWEEMDAEHEFFSNNSSLYQTPELPATAVRADADRNAERLRAMSRFRGRMAA